MSNHVRGLRFASRAVVAWVTLHHGFRRPTIGPISFLDSMSSAHPHEEADT